MSDLQYKQQKKALKTKTVTDLLSSFINCLIFLTECHKALLAMLVNILLIRTYQWNFNLAIYDQNVGRWVKRQKNTSFLYIPMT